MDLCLSSRSCAHKHTYLEEYPYRQNAFTLPFTSHLAIGEVLGERRAGIFGFEDKSLIWVWRPVSYLLGKLLSRYPFHFHTGKTDIKLLYLCSILRIKWDKAWRGLSLYRNLNKCQSLLLFPIFSILEQTWFYPFLQPLSLLQPQWVSQK